MDQSNLANPSLEVLVKEIAKAQDLEMHTSFPAKIHSYDSSTQKASIKPLYKRRFFLFGSGTPVVTDANVDDISIVQDLPVIPGVPVHWPSANSRNAFIHMPLQEGDLGMAICCERSLEKWLKSTGTEPLTNDNVRHHSLSDAWFVPGICTFENTLVGANDEGIVIKNGDTTVEILPNGKIIIINNDAELITVLSDLLSLLKSASYQTTGGPDGPWTTVRNPTDVTALTNIETKINSFKN